MSSSTPPMWLPSPHPHGLPSPHPHGLPSPHPHGLPSPHPHGLYPYPMPVVLPTPTYVPMRTAMPRTDLPAHLITLGNEHSPVCRHFLDGRCERGSACKFSHDLSRGAPTERHRLVDSVRLLSTYALENILRGREAISDVLREDCADRYTAKVVPAPCMPHPSIINQRVRMFELHVQERRGYSVRNPRPRRSLEDVLSGWDEALAGQRFSQLPPDPREGAPPTKPSADGGPEAACLIGRSPSYGTLKLSLHAWAHLCTVYMCECFLDLIRRELVRSHFYEGEQDTAPEVRYETFARASQRILSDAMLPTRYAEHMASPTPHRRVCHHPETFLDALRLAFPQLLVCRSYTTSPTRGAEVKLIAAGKGPQIDAFFDRVAEYVWVIERRTVQPHVHGLRTDSDDLFDKKVRRHWSACVTAVDDMPPAWRQQVRAVWRHILYTQYIAFTSGVTEPRSDIDPPMHRSAPPASPPAPPHAAARHPRQDMSLAQHLVGKRHHVAAGAGAGQWEEWHAADANREANPADNPPDVKGSKNSSGSGEESDALERQREQLFELMDDSD